MKKRGFGKNTHNLPRALPYLNTPFERPGYTEDSDVPQAAFIGPRPQLSTNERPAWRAFQKTGYTRQNSVLKKRILKRIWKRIGKRIWEKYWKIIWKSIWKDPIKIVCMFFKPARHSPSPHRSRYVGGKRVAAVNCVCEGGWAGTCAGTYEVAGRRFFSKSLI